MGRSALASLVLLVLFGCASSRSAEPVASAAEPAAPPAETVAVPAPVVGEVGGEPVVAARLVDPVRRHIDDGTLDPMDRLAVREALEREAARVVTEMAIRQAALAEFGGPALDAWSAGVRESLLAEWGDGDPVEADRGLRAAGRAGLEETVRSMRDQAAVAQWERKHLGPPGKVDEDRVRRIFLSSPRVWGEDFEAARPRIEAMLDGGEGAARGALVEAVLASTEYTPIPKMTSRAARYVR